MLAAPMACSDGLSQGLERAAARLDMLAGYRVVLREKREIPGVYLEEQLVIEETDRQGRALSLEVPLRHLGKAVVLLADSNSWMRCSGAWQFFTPVSNAMQTVRAVTVFRSARGERQVLPGQLVSQEVIARYFIGRHPERHISGEVDGEMLKLKGEGDGWHITARMASATGLFYTATFERENGTIVRYEWLDFTNTVAGLLPRYNVETLPGERRTSELLQVFRVKKIQSLLGRFRVPLGALITDERFDPALTYVQEKASYSDKELVSIWRKQHGKSAAGEPESTGDDNSAYGQAGRVAMAALLLASIAAIVRWTAVRRRR